MASNGWSDDQSTFGWGKKPDETQLIVARVEPSGAC